MLRSLVGSEMCIRDSMRTVLGTRCFETVLTTVLQHFCEFTLSMLCLLICDLKNKKITRSTTRYVTRASHFTGPQFSSATTPGWKIRVQTFVQKLFHQLCCCLYCSLCHQLREHRFPRSEVRRISSVDCCDLLCHLPIDHRQPPVSYTHLTLPTKA